VDILYEVIPVLNCLKVYGLHSSQPRHSMAASCELHALAALPPVLIV
jgi:hypothetical protein